MVPPNTEEAGTDGQGSPGDQPEPRSSFSVSRENRWTRFLRGCEEETRRRDDAMRRKAMLPQLERMAPTPTGCSTGNAVKLHWLTATISCDCGWECRKWLRDPGNRACDEWMRHVGWDRMTTYFTADLHLGHERVVNWRPFDSLDHMHSEIIRRWNAIVRPDDLVWILGDVVMGRRAETLKLVGLLNGKKQLIPGNHDYCHPIAFPGRPDKVERWKGEYEAAGMTVWPYGVVGGGLVNDWDVVMCHFPVSGDHTAEERFTEYRPKLDDGWWLLHGHVHGSMGQVHDGRQIDVGMDAWGFTPVSEGELAELMDNHG